MCNFNQKVACWNWRTLNRVSGWLWPVQPQARNVWWCNQWENSVGLVQCPHSPQSPHSPKPCHYLKIANQREVHNLESWHPSSAFYQAGYWKPGGRQCLIFPNEVACGCRWEMGADGVGALRETAPGHPGICCSYVVQAYFLLNFRWQMINDNRYIKL